MSKEPYNVEADTRRLEAFSDGVFAIAITLLIIEIKVPTAGDLAHQSLAHYLWEQWPKYLAYIFSFVTLGIYWTNHHYVLKLYKRTTHVFLLLNVLFLMAIAFVPFPTGVFGEYILQKEHCETAVIFYSIGLLLPALTWWFVWLYAHKYELIDKKLTPAFIKYLSKQYFLSAVFYIVALLTSFFNTWCCLVLSTAITLLYLLPPKKPEYQKEPHE